MLKIKKIEFPMLGLRYRNSSRGYYSGYSLRTSEFNFQADFQFFDFIHSSLWYLECCLLNAMYRLQCTMSQHYQQVCYRVHVAFSLYFFFKSCCFLQE